MIRRPPRSTLFPTRRSSDLSLNAKVRVLLSWGAGRNKTSTAISISPHAPRSEEHTSELQLPDHLVCRLLLEKKKKKKDRRRQPLSDPGQQPLQMHSRPVTLR